MTTTFFDTIKTINEAYEQEIERLASMPDGDELEAEIQKLTKKRSQMLMQQGIYSMCELTFLIRKAPAKSAYRGLVCAEVRTTLRAQSIIKTLAYNNYKGIKVIEKYSEPRKGWKLMRIWADEATLMRLHEECSPSDEEQLAKNTDRFLTKMCKKGVVEAIKSQYKKADLVKLATKIGTVDAESMTMHELVETIFDAAVSTEPQPTIL